MGIVTDLLAGAPVVVEEEDPATLTDPMAELLPDELSAVARARDVRLREFAAGRRLARRAMARLGGAPQPIRASADRSPEWPAGYAGSITHTAGWCAVAMARQRDLAAVGIDVEQNQPLEQRLWQMICTPRDLQWLNAQAAGARGLLGKLIFSAKESAYKAQYTITRTFLEFSAMSIEVDVRAGVFAAHMEIDVPPLLAVGDVLEGRCAVGPGLLATALLLPPGVPR